mmetsp:Transcript_21293/g.24294  ORF Transcript_21293/g.24294 Transcript_21293/m.24294 type:complete len:1052 (-) Transcript_21293:165-3320(-)
MTKKPFVHSNNKITSTTMFLKKLSFITTASLITFVALDIRSTNGGTTDAKEISSITSRVQFPANHTPPKKNTILSKNTKSSSKNTKSSSKKKSKETKSSSTPKDKEVKKHNILWILLDDISTERFPESGNKALKGMLPGFDELKNDGAVYYPHFYSPSSVCAPSQVSLFSGMEPGDIGGQYQFANDYMEGKANYATVPPPNVKFAPEYFRSLGYWSTGAGKLDYQVGDVMPTFYNEINGGLLVDTLQPSVLNRIWDPAVEQGRPFFGMLNMMDTHQFITSMQREAPVPLTDPVTGGPPQDLPFKHFGYTQPLALLFNTGVNGTAQRGRLIQQDQDEVDIVGYAGDFDISTLSHANGGIPGYLPEDNGIKSILAKEYDIVRNVDYRLQKIVAKLKSDGLYDDTLIMVFGDHGSATHKGKILLQPQSTRTPMWVKYPKETQMSETVHKNNDLHNIDSRMAHITDIYPTSLSVIGKEPELYMTGRALAGKYEDTSPPREMMFSLLARVSDQHAWKSFAAYTKDSFYQTNLININSIQDREQLDNEGEAAMIMDAYTQSLYLSQTSFFVAPIFDRLRKLMRVNALDPTYLSKYYFLAADDARPPSELMFDLRTDPYGTENLLMDYIYSVGQGEIVQKWGNTITNVTLAYGDVSEDRLSMGQKSDLSNLRKGLKEWIGKNTYVSEEVDWTDELFGEENRMAELFWPGGIQPITSDVVVGSPFFHDDVVKSNLSSETDGTVFRHASVSATNRAVCEKLGAENKANIDIMSPVNSGLTPTEYTSIRNQKTYSGFLYGENVNLPVTLAWFLGQVNDCSIFISSDITFMEIDCPGAGNVFVFDSRDSTWDGTGWVGVDDNGDWLSAPVTFWDGNAQKLNMNAFSHYIFGPNRNAIFSGLNLDGTPFTSGKPSELPLNMGFNPAPFFFAVPNEDVESLEPTATTYPSAPLPARVGWSMMTDSSYFKATESPTMDDKGSMQLVVEGRMLIAGRRDRMNIRFESFQYECLLWGVGNLVSIDLSTTESMHFFAQGVRKGYTDSLITEISFVEDNIGAGSNKFEE